MKLLALFAAVLALGAAGSAATPGSQGTKVVASSGAWYTSATTAPIGTTTIASGDFPIGRGPQGEDKRSYVDFEIPTNAKSATIQLRISGATATNFGLPGTIHACPATQAWFPGAGFDLATAPATDCSKPVVGTSSAGTLRFDLTPIVQRWALGMPNHGVAFVAHTDQVLPWQVTFSVSLDEVVGTAALGPASPAAPAPARGTEPLGDPLPFIGAPLPALVPAAVPLDTAELPLVPSAARSTPAPAGPLEALPVHLSLWLLLPGGLVVLYACARALGGGGEPRSALDRVLPT